MANNTEQTPSNLLDKFLEKWYWFLICTVVAIAYSWYKLEKTPRIWQVQSAIIIEEEKGGGGTALPEESIIQGLPFRNRGNLDRHIQILKSRNLMEAVVDSLRLDVLYYSEGRFRDTEMYENLPLRVIALEDKDSLAGKYIRVRPVDATRFAFVPEGTDTIFQGYNVPFKFEGATVTIARGWLDSQHKDAILITFASKRKIAAYYAGQLNLQRRAQSNVLAVTVNDQSPQKIVDLQEMVVKCYNLSAQEEKNKIANKSLDFINERLANLSNELFSAEGSEAAFKSGTDVTTDVEASADRFIEKLNVAEESQAQIASTLNALKNIEGFLLDINNRYELIPDFGDLAGISFATSITQYNRAVGDRKRLLLSATPTHPDVINVSGLLDNLRNSIMSAINLAQQELTRKGQQLANTTAPIQQKVASMPYVKKSLDRITRTVDVKKDLVIYMLQKREETAIGLKTQIESARFLDSPTIGDMPVSPNKRQSYMVAFLLGILLPAGVILLLDRLNDKIQSKSELKLLTTLPLLGEVAMAKGEKGKVIVPGSRSANAEMFRLIRTNLQFMAAGAKENVILITSNAGADGKTFVSGNLAACLSIANKRTVVLELDLRKPSLTNFLMKKPSTRGITNYLVGDCEIKDLLQPIEQYENLWLISSGPTPPNPAELILNDRMERLFEYLKKNFDYVILDTPPVGLVTDAMLLSKYANCSIFVVRVGKTKKEDLKFIEDYSKEGKFSNLSIVLNDVPTPKRYGYYS